MGELADYFLCDSSSIYYFADAYFIVVFDSSAIHVSFCPLIY